MELPKTREDLYSAYFLKEDLAALCRKYGLPATGSKENLLENVCNFIENKPVIKRLGKKGCTFEPSLEAVIDANYRNNEAHRAFFKSVVGEHFKFNVPFINWLNEYRGKKTYREAIEIYRQIVAEKRAGKQFAIGKQFEYNQYTRDFFRENKGLTREDCIKCWNYKKGQKGGHAYEKADLEVLK